MSLEMYKRAWAANVSGSQKLMLLALAEHANSDGICWPGYPRLAAMIGTSKRQAMRIIDKLEQDGLIRKWENRGRGHSNLYFVKVGLSDQEAAEIEQYVEQLIKTKGDTSVRLSNRQKVTSRAIKRDMGVTRTNKELNTKENTLSKDKGKPKKKLSQHPAIQAYRAAWQRYPAANCMQDIIDEVGEDPGQVEFYEKVCRRYKLLGWSPKNHDNMFSYLRKREIPTTNQNGGRKNERQRQGTNSQSKRGTFEKAERARDQKRKTRADQQVDIINI